MCTVSWIYQDGGYELFCNRDEKHTRRSAVAPRLLTRETLADARGSHTGPRPSGSVRLLAPLDGDFGGTWIAVNEFGLSLALLNRHPSSPAKLSRGLVPMQLIPARNITEAAANLATINPTDFAPFLLAALQPDSPAALFYSDGRELKELPDADQHMPLVSSSFDPERVTRERHTELSRLRDCSGGVRTGTLLAFHRSHQPARGPYSPCMHRPDAETVSFTRITVTPAEATLYYAPGAPCSSLAGESWTLAIGNPPQSLTEYTAASCR